ncbi:DUF4123 domain-containing protein [Halomonas sp. 328]|uniref:DUF4123 domain-containing protein n=1 Tax=Halomonas sp. 328 TaxID=2776704 RepID=UPI0018A76550|nr:DUF4123 domain-containing protein [Halomonas sp. 328]MBF8223788.1 DUF4123 domain-containing protein [Halomonas sp. 328]
MNNDWTPGAWQTTTPLYQVKRYALVELASLPAYARTELFAAFQADDHYWPLLDDPSQPHLQREGPWLLEVNDTRGDAWRNLESIDCALHAWIESELPGEQLASQLAPAMVIENSMGRRSLLRFYLPEVIERLHADAPQACHDALFGNIQRWWYRSGGKEWVALEGFSRQAPSGPWELRVGDELWMALHGDTEVMGLTAELVDIVPELFGDICSCDRPRLVRLALEQADSYGLTRISDRRVYAYLQLSQGEAAWQSDEMRSWLEHAANGETPLLDLLDNAYGEPI